MNLRSGRWRIASRSARELGGQASVDAAERGWVTSRRARLGGRHRSRVRQASARLAVIPGDNARSLSVWSPMGLTVNAGPRRCVWWRRQRAPALGDPAAVRSLELVAPFSIVLGRLDPLEGSQAGFDDLVARLDQAAVDPAVELLGVAATPGCGGERQRRQLSRLASVHAARDQGLLELHKCREQPQLMHTNRARIGEVVERDGGLIPAHPGGQRPCETIGDAGPRSGELLASQEGRR